MHDKNCENSRFVLLSIGANLGHRKGTIKKAVHLLDTSGIISEAKVSSIYETEPVGFSNQPWFLNIAVSGTTELPLFNLIQSCKSIEYLLGREDRERWHEREIDIDILLYGEKPVKNDNITVPHPRMHERKFVLMPAAEIAKEAVHPEKNKTIEELLENCNDNSEVRTLTA